MAADAERLDAAREALAAAEAAASASGLRPAEEKRRGGREPDGASSGGGPPGRGLIGAGRPGEPDPHDVARRSVLRQLAMGPRTRKQLEDKLRDRGTAPDVAARVLDRMGEVGLVDDEAYAEMFVRSQQETKGLAASALRHELRRKGVADELVDAVLDEVDPEREKDQARALVTRRLRTMRGLDREVQTRRLAAYLARKGYGSSVSYQVVREALDSLPEHSRD
ncbi:regulatory protein RecX [Ornithinimicrobium avium]|uniref:Regulatory protein RecX n=1 Tax=Ornithinimicrobium avium TaxID=2283195 RepID=A0A345NIE7_9MICO|nr:regulatory protein RecX [Ornithinimicrobium avium]AXH94805.1 regulatory protein RecX [Ornithinimicrobium avium]